MTITDAALKLGQHTLASGAMWLLPVWHLTGSLVAVDGTTSPYAQVVLAVEPQYVEFGPMPTAVRVRRRFRSRVR